MKKNIIFKTMGAITAFGASLVLFTQKTYAQSLLPDQIQELLNLMGPEGEATGSFISSRVQSALVIGLALLILAAIVYAGFAAFKYIKSQGDPGELEEAGKATKAIFYGIIVLLVSAIGIVLIFVFFGSALPDSELYQTCITAPGSEGCLSCRQGGIPEEYDEDKFQTSNPYSFTNVTNALTDPQARQNCGYCEWQYFQVSRGNLDSVSDVCDE